MERNKTLFLNFVAWLFYSFLVQISMSSTCDEADDISPCTCSFTRNITRVDCSGNGFRSVPYNLPERVSVLDLSDNLLQPESLKSICRYKYLRNVSIAGNNLTQLSPRSLLHCGKAKSFNFSGNVFDNVTKFTLYGLEFIHVISGLESRNFSEDCLEDIVGLKELGIVLYQRSVPVQIFKDRNLEKLTIDIRGATSIPETLLDPLASVLTELILKSTSIQTIPKTLLSNFRKMKTCVLHFIELHSIPSTLFQNEALYGTLEYLSLSGIKSLPRKVFWNLDALRHLEIHGAEDMPSDLFFSLLGLETLDLSHSTLTVIPYKWFSDLWSLKTLDLSNIGLVDAEKRNFNNLRSLDKLDLSGNFLRNLSHELFHEISASVKFINISGNMLKKLPRDLFTKHAVLECLDISTNQISAIENEAFYHLSELKRLYLQNNELYDLEVFTFIQNINIAYLDISSNKLIDLPGELFTSTTKLEVLNLSNNLIANLERSIKFNIPTLREINLSYNPIECNCGTQAVKESLSKVSIIGHCENPQPGIAIVDFVPDTNCVLSSDKDLFVTNFTSSTVFASSTESREDAWETKSVINDLIWKSAGEYKSSTVNLYTSRKLSGLWMNNSTSLNYPNTRINNLTTSKLNASEFKGVASLEITPSPSYGVTQFILNKSSVVIANTSNVHSGGENADFSIVQLNTTKVHKTPSVGDEIVSKLVSHTAPTASDYHTDKRIASKVELDTFKTEYLITYFRGYEENKEVTPTRTLSPSFETIYATSFIESSHFLTGGATETLQPTTVSSVLLINVTQALGDLDTIPVSVTIPTEDKDESKMTDGFLSSNESTGTSLNITALPPKFELGYSNVTTEPEMQEKGGKSDYFYLSLISILSVAIFSVLILVFLYYKKRRSVRYEIQRRTDLDVYDLDQSFHEEGRDTPNSAFPFKQVPSIQIESVDDDGNVRVEIYPISQTKQ